MKQLVMAVIMVMCFASVVFAGTNIGGEWVDSDVTLATSGTFYDVGDEIDTRGTDDLGIALSLSVGDSTTAINVKALGLHTEGGADEYIIPLTDPSGNLTLNSNDYSYSFDSGVSEKVLLKWNLDDVVPYTQIQASAIMSASSNVSISSMVIIENR